MPRSAIRSLNQPHPKDASITVGTSGQYANISANAARSGWSNRHRSTVRPLSLTNATVLNL